MNYEVLLPMELTSQMTARHQACGELADHHLVPGDDLGQVGATLSQQLGRPVLAVQPPGGWTFKGAGVCMVGSDQAAHLIFVRGNQTLSIYSLPGSACGSAPAGSSYATLCKGVPVVGVLRRGGLYCLVGSSPDGSLKLEDLEAILKALRSQFSPAASACQGSSLVRAGI